MDLRNRLILELMARAGMRIGEVLQLTRGDIQGRKQALHEPKSRKDCEFVFIPQKIADRLKGYADENCSNHDDRIFPISYQAAIKMVFRDGKMVGIHLRPPDHRKHCATYASASRIWRSDRDYFEIAPPAVKQSTAKYW
jgi:integrase